MKKSKILAVLALALLTAGCQAAPVSVSLPIASPDPVQTDSSVTAEPVMTAFPAITLSPETVSPEDPAVSAEEKALKLRVNPDTLAITVVEEGTLQSMAGERPVLRDFVGWEIPPCLVKLQDKWKVLLSTAQTGMVGLREGSDFFQWGNYDLEDITMLCGENVRSEDYRRKDETHYWGRNYYGVFDTWQDDRHMFFLTHCENKNDLSYGRAWANSVMPPDTVFGEQDYSGDFGDGWRDYWPGYFAFATLSVIPQEGQETLPAQAVRTYDRGPIIWPAMPYLDENHQKVASGIRHPSLLVDKGYMYLFYLDDSPGYEGIHAARAQMGEDGLPGPFFKCYNGAFTEPGLPEGFTWEDPENRSFFYQGSGKSTPLFTTGEPCRFSAAALGDTGLYVGTLEKMAPKAATYIAFSRDLVHWGKAVMIPGSKGSGWNDMPLAYPKLFADDLTSQSPVDPACFRVVGTGMGSYGGYWYAPIQVELGE